MKQIGYFLWWQCCEWRNRFRAYWGINRFLFGPWMASAYQAFKGRNEEKI
jgi:hypothetical protein